MASLKIEPSSFPKTRKLEEVEEAKLKEVNFPHTFGRDAAAKNSTSEESSWEVTLKRFRF